MEHVALKAQSALAAPPASRSNHFKASLLLRHIGTSRRRPTSSSPLSPPRLVALSKAALVGRRSRRRRPHASPPGRLFRVGDPRCPHRRRASSASSAAAWHRVAVSSLTLAALVQSLAPLALRPPPAATTSYVGDDLLIPLEHLALRWSLRPHPPRRTTRWLAHRRAHALPQATHAHPLRFHYSKRRSGTHAVGLTTCAPATTVRPPGKGSMQLLTMEYPR